MPRILSITSKDYARRTGGFVYNNQFIAALRGYGLVVDDYALEMGFPSVAEVERARLARQLRQAAADTVILVDHIYVCDMPEVLASCRIPVISIFHHSLVIEHGDRQDAESDRIRQMEAKALRACAGIITTSQESSRYIQAHYGISPARIHVAVPGNHRVARSKAGMSSGKPVDILSVGAVIPRKRYDYLVDVASALGDQPWRWRIAGDPQRHPPYLAQLQQSVRDRGLADRFQFLGDVPDADLEELWQTSDLYVAASHYEGYGMAIAEAFRHGVPVVTTASGAVSTWAAGGLVQAPADDAGGMAEVIGTFLSDRHLLSRQAEHAWRFGQTLPTWEETFADVAGWVASAANDLPSGYSSSCAVTSIVSKA